MGDGKPKTTGRLGENDAIEITLDGKPVTTIQRSDKGRFGLDFHGQSGFKVKRRKLPAGRRTSKVVAKRPVRAHGKT